MQCRIPFTKPHIGPEERAAVLRALDSADLGGNGPLSIELQHRLCKILGSRYALFTTSCSSALELAAMVLRLRPGDEVIMPSFTFVTTASSMLRAGARPVFAEIDAQTWNLDPEQVEAHITPNTRAILPVHYGGYTCAMEALMDIARRHNLYVIEDAAQGFGSTHHGQPLGTIGHIGCFSFHVTKNIVGGEGGAFVTNDDELVARAEIIREKGTNRSQFLRGMVDKYTWVDVGASFVQSDIVAGVILAQLDKQEAMYARRKVIWERYHEGLAELESRGYILRPRISSEHQINWHLYAFLVSDQRWRDEVLSKLRQRGIDAVFHFVPLHSSPYARSCWGYCPEDLPITERVAASLIRLPLYPDLASSDQEYILEALYEIMLERSQTHRGLALEYGASRINSVAARDG